MAKAKASIVINKPIEEVFDYTCSVANGPAFIPNLNENTEIQGDGVGQTYNWRFNMAGVDLKGKGEVTVFDRPHREEMSITGDTTANWVFSFEEENGGTKATVEVDYDIVESALQKLANRMVVDKFNQKTAEQMLDNLKTILES